MGSTIIEPGKGREKKRVAIIGAGLSGLVACKECLAEGAEDGGVEIAVDVFESRAEIGGQWAYQAEPDPATGELHSSIYDGVVLNSCRDTTGFSDFPVDPARYGDYFTHWQMHQYLLEYADHFNLLPHIRLSTKVLGCVPNGAGNDGGKEEDHEQSTTTWTVTFQGPDDKQPQERTYDAVISAIGYNTIPLVPDFKGLKENFRGEFLHGHYYRRPGRFEGQRVAIIGAGSSALDMACELAPGCREVHLVTRRGTWVIPRYVLGKPVEAWDNRATQIWMPGRVSEWLQQLLLDLVQGPHPDTLKPDHRLMQQNPTIRSEFLERVRNGQVHVHRADVDGFEADGRSLLLSDGTRLANLDAVIACTGYHRVQPHLPADVLHGDGAADNDDEIDGIHVYKMVVPQRYRNLYFVGLSEQAGPAAPAAEACARYAVGAIAGHHAPPAGEALRQAIRVEQAWRRAAYVPSQRHANSETYVPFLDQLAAPLGANPTFGRLLFGRGVGGLLARLRTLNAVYFDVTSSAQWRLCGRGAKPELARETILRISRGDKELSKRERELLGLK
ncbi:Flavin-binding monooxygenase-like family protein [Apiospora kogelbergensis]|uniref:Flavin-binding monooxygenase-like family protein n=1 Tax=Apiospora kogelbergensis TaxID=1337665 RepID=A0AAW0RAH0_9PEZI